MHENRPFLRCLHGLLLCQWRQGLHQAAAARCERLLWLNPTDNQGIRMILDPIRDGEPWEEYA